MTRTLTLVFTLALLFGVAYLSATVVHTDLPEERLTLLMGFVLLAATVAGSLAGRMGLPKIIGFLVVGILAGPSVSELIPWGALDELRLIEKFALALIALLAGGELKIDALRPAENRLFRAGPLAIAAFDAALRHEPQLRTALQGLRVLTPMAAERASLEEDDRPDPGAVVNGVALDVEYDRLAHRSRPYADEPSAHGHRSFAARAALPSPGSRRRR